MMLLFPCLLLCVGISLASELTVYIGKEELPHRIFVARGDTIKFINVDDVVHYISSDELPSFISDFIYPITYKSNDNDAHKRLYKYYVADDAPTGDFEYQCDVHDKRHVNSPLPMRGLIHVVESFHPLWEMHPGAPRYGGALRPSTAFIPPSRLNSMDEITPPTVGNVKIRVTLVGSSAAVEDGDDDLGTAVAAGLASRSTTIFSSPQRIDRSGGHSLSQVYEFTVDARSFSEYDEVYLVVKVGEEEFYLPTRATMHIGARFDQDDEKYIYSTSIAL